MENDDLQFNETKRSLLETESTLDLGQFAQVNMESLNVRKSSTQPKKFKKLTESEESFSKKDPECFVEFNISQEMIRLLRKPEVEPGHRFKVSYLKELQSILAAENSIPEADQMYMYLHLIIAQIENLQELEILDLEGKELPEISRDWNKTNIMQPACILANIRKNFGEVKRAEAPKKSLLSVMIVKKEMVYFQKKGILVISKRFLEIATEAKGHLDIYFAPFLFEKLDGDPVFRVFKYCKQVEEMSVNYANIFQKIVIEVNNFTSVNYKEWYLQKIKAIVENEFNINELKNALNARIKNDQIEKLLIGLQGWDAESEEAIKLLNMFYDGCDWQSGLAYRPTVAQTGDPYTINYLIENLRNEGQELVVCVKAPCLNPECHQEYFSWHIPKLNQYISDDEKYLWLHQDLGCYTKCGFYDWSVFLLKEDKKAFVNKILDIKETKRLGSQIMKKNVMNVKAVKGRVIVQPEKVKKLQIHEVYIDAIQPENSPHRQPQFCDVGKKLQKYNESGINTVYLSGVFERDNGQFPQGFKRPQASPMALTERTLINRMLGGPKQFKKVVTSAKNLKMKVIIDCTTLVSSSRMDRKYESHRLQYIDSNGKKQFFYTAQGRGIREQETALLNYRKRDTWYLLLQEIFSIVEQFGIDGIYIDNGFASPQVHELDHDQLFRKKLSDEFVYSYEEIFDGEIIIKRKLSGYHVSEASSTYANPFLVFLCKNIWKRYPQFLVICEGVQTIHSAKKLLSVIHSGPIPKVALLPKSLSEVKGRYLHDNGNITDTAPKTVTLLKKWYEELIKHLPKNSILIQSTTSHVWPNPAFIFKQMTWAVVDLFFFLPDIPMTFGDEEDGKAYRHKSLNIFRTNFIETSKKGHDNSASTVGFFEQENESSKQEIECYSNKALCDPSNMKNLEQNFKTEVGPQFGFNLAQICKHYQHRRKMREDIPLLTSGRMLSLSAEHAHGIHSNVLAFAKWDQKGILLVSINFNASAIIMFYNLSSLKELFSKAARSTLVVKIVDALTQEPLKNPYYTVGELINSRIETGISAYSSILWSVLIQGDDKLNEALDCSRRRIAESINANPPKWVYSSILTNQLSYFVDKYREIDPFITQLNMLYNEFILPDNLNFSLVLSKTHNFWLHKVKLEKLFGILKMIQDHEKLLAPLRQNIQQLIMGNTLGPIAFVTPEIGAWSSVGGLGVMVDELSKELVRLGEEVYIITPYYEYNKKRETNYLLKDGFQYSQNITTGAAQFKMEFGIHRGQKNGVKFVWFHNPELFSKPYEGEGAFYVSKQLVFFALAALECFCQLKIIPSMVITNDWMCGFVSGYVKCGKYGDIFSGTKFMHICHNLDPLYEGRLYPKFEDGTLEWLIQLPPQWYIETRNNKLIINPSKCALQTCDNWGTVSNSYKYDLLKESPLADILRKHPNPFAFPNGVRKQERLSIIKSKTPGNHIDSKKLLQQKYFQLQEINNDIPLFAFIGRVTKQKGVHLILDVVEDLLFQFNFKIQFIVGGPSDSKQDYGKFCADWMKLLSHKYPKNFWSNPDAFFTDGALVNIGADFALMPSLFQPGGIVQHEFFSGGTPVVAFRTGGLKDTVFEYDLKTEKGNGFNFMSYEVEDFKNCMKRATNCYNNKKLYDKLRENAFDSVVEEEDVARGWNTEFYRLQNKVYIDWSRVEQEISVLKATKSADESSSTQNLSFRQVKGQYWKPQWDIMRGWREVLKNCSRLKVNPTVFYYQTDKIPRPKDVFIAGDWDDWKSRSKMHFDKIFKKWSITLKLRPGTYAYKFIVDGEWLLSNNIETVVDANNNKNHVAIID